MPVLTIEGSRVHYAERRGGRQAVVFLHGGFGSSAELWSNAMAALPETCSGYAIDNFLHSDAPPDGYNVAAFARRAGAFIEALRLDHAVLVGHSMGGVVCQLAALTFPERVGGLVLVCTGAAMTNHQLGRRLLDELRGAAPTPEKLRSISAHWFHGRVPEALFERYVALAANAPLQAMIDVQASLIATDLRDRLPQIKAPTLVVFGAHDRGRTFDHARTLLDGIPGSELATMNSGHTPMFETPGDFDAALHAFLSRTAMVSA